LENGGEWVVDQPTLLAFYIGEKIVPEVEKILNQSGYACDGSEQNVFADAGSYMRFRVSKSSQFMFRVSLKEKNKTT
jgi:hypothetical protein